MIIQEEREAVSKIEGILRGHKYRAKRIAKELGQEEKDVKALLDKLIQDNCIIIKGLYYYLRTDVEEKQERVKKKAGAAGDDEERRRRGRKPKAADPGGKPEGGAEKKKRGRKPKNRALDAGARPDGNIADKSGNTGEHAAASENEVPI